MASLSSAPDATSGAPIPDDENPHNDLPLTMSASVVLTTLPPDAHAALEIAAETGPKKVTVRFKAVGAAPILRNQVYKISAAQRFETVVNFLRTRLRVAPTASLFLYVNSVFAPALDEIVGNLFACFKADDQLIVAYSMTPAFG